MKKDALTGTLGALVANGIFGFSYYFSKMALATGAHPLVILSIRFTVAFLAMSLLALCRVIRLRPLARVSGGALGKLLAMAVMQPLLYFIFELYALDNTSTAVSGVVIGTVPAVVMLASAVLLHERPGRAQAVFGLLSVACIAGISLIGGHNGSTTPLGILLLVGAVVTAAGFNLLSRSVAGEFTAIERTYAMFAVGAVGFDLLTPLVLRRQFLPALRFAVEQRAVWLAMIYLSLLSSIAAYMLYNHATGKIGLVRASAFSGVIPVVSMLSGIFLLGESLTPVQIALCAAVIGCIYAVNRLDRTAKKGT